MAEKADSEYSELIKKRDKMVDDKASIQAQITQLDALKNDTLAKTFEIVNTAFARIFATLLPGADA